MIPRRDFEGNIRALPCNLRAYDSSLSSGDIPASPSNSGAPTIAECTEFTNEFQVTDIGTWSGMLTPYHYEPKWDIDGQDPRNSGGSSQNYLNPIKMAFVISPASGNLRCTVHVANLSGVRVSAPSGTLTA